MRVFVVPVEHSDVLVSPAGAEHVTIDRVGVDTVDGDLLITLVLQQQDLVRLLLSGINQKHLASVN